MLYNVTFNVMITLGTASKYIAILKLIIIGATVIIIQNLIFPLEEDFSLSDL